MRPLTWTRKPIWRSAKVLVVPPCRMIVDESVVTVRPLTFTEPAAMLGGSDSTRPSICSSPAVLRCWDSSVTVLDERLSTSVIVSAGWTCDTGIVAVTGPLN